jgi:uncharacterized protein
LNKIIFQALLAACFLIFSSDILAQDSTKSLAFKNNRPQRNNPYFYRPDLAYQIWQQFKLNQEANAGDALAQHELGLRYLLGDGIPADTVKAVYWIKKAAEKNLTAAKYNLGIMLINGIGTNWDPFLAFKYFRSAAREGMNQAQYVLGVLYTDNLIVKRDWNLAYFWIKKSADNDFESAKEILPELEPKISKHVVDSLFNLKNLSVSDEQENSTETKIPSSLGLMFIDFSNTQDTTFVVTDSMIVADLKYAGEDSIIANNEMDSLVSLHQLKTEKRVKILNDLADNGSPEAQTILGKMYEEGINYSKNIIKAASYYFRALRNDSPKATNILWHLAGNQDFISLLISKAKSGDPEAKFVWYGLTSIGFDNRIVISDALKMLVESSVDGYLPSYIELGLNYYTGRYVNKDETKGITIWKEAEQLGSDEAVVRLISSELIDGFIYKNQNSDFQILKTRSDKGSLLAQVTIGICYEQGLGTKRSIPDAVKYYRDSAQRGSQFAYNQLKRMYDSIRPDDPDFIIAN